MQAHIRGIDHVVFAVRDLDAAARFYGALGFTMTPRNRHPFGTANHLAILDGNFLEVLGVERPEKIPAHAPGRYSFAAHNAALLERREGPSFLVLDSADARADHRDFLARGLETFDPVDFSRGAPQPDGSERTVAFSLVFVVDPRMPDAPHFVCQQHNPEHFWKAAYQRHANTARRISLVTLAADDLDAAAAHYRALFGAEAVAEDGGAVRVCTGRGSIEVLPAREIGLRFRGVDVPLPDRLPAFVGVQVAVADLAAAAAVLEANGVAYHMADGVLRLAPAHAHGAALELVRG